MSDKPNERITTLHPAGKSGANILKTKYEAVASAILDALADGELAFQSLTEAVQQRLAGNFEGSISWYVTTVKLDLEARGQIERIAGSSPQRLRRVD